MSDAKNSIKIDDIGPCRKRISIDIPASKVDETLAASYDVVAHEAAIPGFRKGHAPRRLIEKRFGEYVRGEARQRLVSSAYKEAVESNDLKVLSQPSDEIFEDLEIEDGKPVHIEIEVEVMPEFDLPDLKGLKVLKPDAKLPDDLVDKEIEKIGINEGSLDERDKPERGDYLTGNAVMKDAQGTEHYNIEGAVVRIPEKGDEEGMILGVIVADFAKQIGLPKEGETKTIKVKGPEQHEMEDIRGKDLTVTFEVVKVYRIVPAPMADIVAKFGFTGEEQLREMVGAQLGQRAEVQQQAVMRQQIAKTLADACDFELPAGLTANQAARNLERQRMELMYRGMPPTEVEQKMAELRNASTEQATSSLKQLFILGKVAEQLEVSVEEPEINAQIVRFAMEQGKRPEQLRDELVKNGQIQTLIQQVREHKAIDAVLVDADIEEVSAEEFNKRMSV
ncbi:MAG: trigger factor [Phycisphaerales bacterium]|nr:trigger factor [Phycisphaerales bacterium]